MPLLGDDHPVRLGAEATTPAEQPSGRQGPTSLSSARGAAVPPGRHSPSGRHAPHDLPSAVAQTTTQQTAGLYKPMRHGVLVRAAQMLRLGAPAWSWEWLAGLAPVDGVVDLEYLRLAWIDP